MIKTLHVEPAGLAILPFFCPPLASDRLSLCRMLTLTIVTDAL